MSRGVALLDSHGEALEPSALVAAPVALEEEQVALLCAAARREGRALERDGLSLHGYGDAGRISLPGGLETKGAARAAEEVLGAIATEGEARAVAFGALAFLPTRPGHLSLARLTVVQRGAARHVIELRRAGQPSRLEALLVAAAAIPDTTELPESFQLASSESHEHFRSRVREALVAIDEGRFDKVVLARQVEVHADRPFSPAHLLARLRQLHPSCLTFSVDQLLGASPELLCRRLGSAVTSQPLAGTVGRSGDPEEDARLAASLLASDKERAEHAVVVEAIRAGLSPYAAHQSISERPHLLELRNVVHLATTVEARLSEPAVGCLELVAALHPTPAVGGWPRDAALDYLAHTESLDRGRYAGPVGYLDSAGDGEFWLGIRSAMLDGRDARLLAGVGIVKGSQPDAELAETQLKLQALLAAAVRP